MDSQTAPHTSDAPAQAASAASSTESILNADPSNTRTQTVISNSIFNPGAASDAALRLKIAYLLQKFVSCSIASLGVILVLLALSIMCYLFYSWFNHILPLIGGYTMWNTAQTAFGLFLLYGVFFNYMMTLRTGPGHVPADLDHQTNMPAQTSTVTVVGEQSTLLPLGVSKYNQMGFCTKCDRPKPPRAHHCHLCNTCVLKMDHHCPWIANCAGHFNYRYFYLFLLYLCTGTAWMTVITWYPSFHGLESDPRHDMVFFDFVLCISLSAAVGALLLFHTYLILSAQTTIEFYQNRLNMLIARRQKQVFHNPYDLGYKRNWQFVFGNSSFWFLPYARPAGGDGLQWPINPKVTE